MSGARRGSSIAAGALLAVVSVTTGLVPRAGAASSAAAVAAQSAQVARGQQVYAQTCMVCHGVDLEGAVGPALDKAHLAGYGNAARLYQYTRGTMPLDAPGSLAEQQYYDVLAYVLARNSLLPDDTPVDAGTAESIALRN